VRRVLKWLGTAVCVLTVVEAGGWVFSPGAWVPRPKYSAPRWGFAVGGEHLAFYYVTILPPPGKTAANFTEQSDLVRLSRSVRDPQVCPYGEHFDALTPTVHGFLPYTTQSGFGLRYSYVYVPLVSILLLMLVLAVPVTSAAWYFDRRHILPDHCEECGYNLTGNVSGRCPECGQPVTRAVQHDG
jgi:hypothetical protein